MSGCNRSGRGITRRGLWRWLPVLLLGTAALAQERVVDRMEFISMWDDSYLYLGARLEDVNVVGRHRGYNEANWEDDEVEVLLDTSRFGGSAELQPNCFKIGMSAAEGVFCGRGAGEPGQRKWELLPPVGADGKQLRQAVQVHGTLNDPADADQGWEVELAVPWSLLGRDGPPTGETWHFNVVRVLRGDADAAYSFAPRGREGSPATWVPLVFRAGVAGVEPGGAITCAQVPPRPGGPGPLLRRRPWPAIDGHLADDEWPLANRIDVRLSPDRLVPLQPVAYPRLELSPLPLDCDTNGPTQGERRPRGEFRGDSLVLASYYLGLQGDDRQTTHPPQGVWDADGHSRLAATPLDGLGPWASTLRVGWHRDQLQRALACNIDALLVEYAGDPGSRRAYSLDGLRSLVLAAQELRFQRQPCPQLALLLPLRSLAIASGRAPDLRQPGDQELVYRLIRDFYLQVPPYLRASVIDGARRCCLVALDQPPVDAALGDEFLGTCEQRFRAEFGADLLWLGSASWGRRSVGLDGFVYFDAGVEQFVGNSGRVKLASVGPGYDDARSAAQPLIVPRASTRTFRAAVRGTLDSPARWLLLASLNDLLHGTQLLATREYGGGYERTASVLALQFGNRREVTLLPRVVRADVPARLISGHRLRCPVRLANAGLKDWEFTDGLALGYRWLTADAQPLRGPDGREVIDRATGKPILADKPLTDTCRLSDPLTAPVGATRETTLEIVASDDAGHELPPGRYRLRLEAAHGTFKLPVETVGPDGKKVKHEVERPAWIGTQGDEWLDLPVEVLDELAAPVLAAELLEVGLPARVESGANQPVNVVLRNTGTAQLAGGLHLAVRYERLRSAGWCVQEPAPVPLSDWLDCASLPPVEAGELVRFTALVPVRGPAPDAAPEIVTVARFTLRDDTGRNFALDQPYTQAVQVLARDYGASFGAINVPQWFSAGAMTPVEVTVINPTLRPWLAAGTELTWGWYRRDGAPLRPDAGRLRLSADVAPGKALTLAVPVVAPATLGWAYLCFDVLHDGNVRASLQPGTASRDLAPIKVWIASLGWQPLPLAKLLNVRGASFDEDPAAGDFDGHGRSWPAELLPPDTSEPQDGFYPSAYLEHDPGDYPTLMFRYPTASPAVPPPPPPRKLKKGETPPPPPPRTPRVPAFTAVRPDGQTLDLPAGAFARLHLLAAGVDGDVTLNLAVAGKTGPPRPLPPVLITSWDQPARHGEGVGFCCARRNGPAGPEAARCWLHRVTVPLPPLPSGAKLVLPKAPGLRLVAITLEASPDTAGPVAPAPPVVRPVAPRPEVAHPAPTPAPKPEQPDPNERERPRRYH